MDLICEENAARRTGKWHSYVTQVELLKLQKSGQFPDELLKIEDAQIHCVASQVM
jgi:hypothetical protein